jgi:thymidylate synthase
MVIGDASMLNKENTDHRCTMYISYQIRDNVLEQTVHMRSNDAIFGITNDVFFFGLLHQMVYVSLLDTYPDLKLGDYIHLANSLHVYERHFGMLKSLAEQGVDGFTSIDMPVFESKEEVNALRLHQGEVPCAFTSGIVPWLLELS